jgi:hypothetical protein
LEPSQQIMVRNVSTCIAFCSESLVIDWWVSCLGLRRMKIW